VPKLAVLTFSVVVLACCSAGVASSRSVSQSDLEEQVVETITPDDAKATVDATCADDLDRKVDATQDCHVEIGDETADVRVNVTGVDGNEVEFDLTPYVPTDRVAETIQDALGDEGFQVDSVECEDELLGVVGEVVTCSARPAEGDGTTEATVTSVHGLKVNFDYEVVG
jgi:hypothetical protein